MEYLIPKIYNILKVGIIGKQSFLPIKIPNQPHVIFEGKSNQSWVISGSFESDIKGVPIFDTLNELLLGSDVVIINDLLHSNYSVLAHIIRNCKHIFINHSFPLTQDELSSLHLLSQEAAVVIQMGLHHRFSQIYKAIIEKEITPRLIETNHFMRYSRRSTQLSIISDVLLQDLDYIIKNVKSDIISIRATGVGVIYNDPDIINIRLEFQNACIANISASKIAIKDIHKTRFYQNDLYYTLDYLANTIKVFNTNDESFWENTDESDSHSGSVQSFTNAEANELPSSGFNSFINAIFTKINSPASLYDHLAIKFVAEKIYDQLERNFVAKCG